MIAASNAADNLMIYFGNCIKRLANPHKSLIIQWVIAI